MAKFITAKEAAQLIPDHATVGVAGMGLSGWPEEVACAIRDNFAETGHPCDLNLKQASALGDRSEEHTSELQHWVTGGTETSLTVGTETRSRRQIPNMETVVLPVSVKQDRD